MTKLCSKCKKELDISLFNKCSNSKDNLSIYCKFCVKEMNDLRKNYKKEYYKQNKSRISDKSKEYYKQNKEKIKEYQKEYYKQNKDEIIATNREYQIRNKERIKEYQKEYQLLNKNALRLQSKEYQIRNREKIIEYKKGYYKRNREEILKRQNEKRNTSFFRLNASISQGIYVSLKQSKTDLHWESLVDYTLIDLKQHLELQFTTEMSWDNYGSYWEIDHIIPKNLFKFSTNKDREFKICWSLANLRPLEKIKNRSRPKDGSDISESLKNRILLQYND